MAERLFAPLRVERPKPEPKDAILVLGAPPDLDGQLGLCAGERIRVGVDLWARGLGRLLILSGHRGEAEAMAQEAGKLGVSETIIRLERRARNTRENALYGAQILAEEGGKSVWVVSQPYHLKRALFWCRRAGLRASPWHARHSVQFQRPDLAIGWLAREYAAWAALGVWVATNR